MEAQPKARQIASTLLTIVVWLVTFGLGLQSIYLIKEFFVLIYVQLGGGLEPAQRIAPALVFISALGFLVFIIASTEYHMKRAGTPESWRLFGWTLAVELSFLILYYIL